MKLALALLLISVSLHAQSLPNTPTVRVKLIDESINKPITITLPVPHRTADRSFWIWTSISNGLTIADTENSIYGLKSPYIIEADPIFGQHPNRLRFYEIDTPISILQTWISYREKKSNDAARAFGATVKWYSHWWLMPLSNSVIHAVAISVSYGLTGR